MKYMGSKRWMLRNGLGHLIHREIKTAKRFVDLFAGSGAVARFAATSPHPIKVIACDLQTFSASLAGSVISRTKPFSPDGPWDEWLARATRRLIRQRKLTATQSPLPGLRSGFNRAYIDAVRARCAMGPGPVTRAYGGYYFSRSQALWLDALRATLPRTKGPKEVALAALIQAASECSASPGHTAQPFRPTRGARRFLRDAWRQDVVLRARAAFFELAATHAKKNGVTWTADANAAASKLKTGDLVFLDPPYSGVHYSRFYHVLETIARGRCGPVEGNGRYPPPHERPQSAYSVSSQSVSALEELLRKLAQKKAKAILTFPQKVCSNGLSGTAIQRMAQKYFRVKSTFKRSRFSTLGGTIDDSGKGYGRRARQRKHELILMLRPRTKRTFP